MAELDPDWRRHLLAVTPEQWTWSSHLGLGGGTPGEQATATEQCAFAWGPRSQSKIVVCDMEGLQAQDGSPQLRAVQGMCPECGSTFRIDPLKSPCSVEEDPAVFETERGPVKFRRLTVYIPILCNAPVAVISDEGQVAGTGQCSWKAVIRRGRGYSLDEVRQILPRAIQTAQQTYQQVWQWLKGQNAPASWLQSVEKVWADALPSIQRIQSGQYERQGPLSIVGAWDRVDHVIAACQAIVQQAQQQQPQATGR